MIAEKHAFDVDKSIINHLIHSQNGTKSTSIRELIMNSIDAGCDRCEITVGKKGFSVSDNGRGFGTKDDVLRQFKTFGKEHADSRKYGRFRIGRGQILSFAKVTWHSGPFKMITDVANKGLEFELVENANDVFNGCKVHGSFYQSIDEWDLANTLDGIKKLVKYCSMTIILNGEELDTKNDDWNYEDDDVKIKWNSTDWSTELNLYNMGIYVCDFKTTVFGVSGEVVTKIPLKMNMARNAINESDPLWIKVKNIIINKGDEIVKDKVKNHRGLNLYEKEAMISNYKIGMIDFADIYKHALIKDCRGKYLSFNKLAESNLPITVSPSKHNAKAERLSVLKNAIVLHEGAHLKWGFDNFSEFINHINDNLISNELIKDDRDLLITSDFDYLAQDLIDSHDILEQKQLSKKQKAFKSALLTISNLLYHKLKTKKRTVFLGESDVADAWTDGYSFIGINKNNLKILDSGPKGAVYIINLLVHEYCHDTSDLGSHEHNFEFYEKFHDFQFESPETMGRLVKSLITNYSSALRRYNLRIPSPLIEPSVKSDAEYHEMVTKKVWAIEDRLKRNYEISKGAVSINVIQSDYKRPIHKYALLMLNELGDLSEIDGGVNVKFDLKYYGDHPAQEASKSLVKIMHEDVSFPEFTNEYDHSLFKVDYLMATRGDEVDKGNSFMMKLGLKPNSYSRLLKIHTADELLNFLVDNELFNVKHFEGLYPSTTYFYGSPQTTFKTQDTTFLPDDLGIGTDCVTNNYLPVNRYVGGRMVDEFSGRQKIALHMLESAVNCLKSEERDEFINTYLTDRGKASVG